MKASIVGGIILAAAMAIAAPALAQVVPRPDSGTADAGIKSKPIANVVANETINGAPAVLGASGNATIESSGMWPPGLVLNTMSGALTTATTLAAGVYSVSYELCDLSSNCASTTDTVTVITPVINPLPGSGTADFGVRSQPIANVAANDTVNGAPAIWGAAGNARVLQSPTLPLADRHRAQHHDRRRDDDVHHSGGYLQHRLLSLRLERPGGLAKAPPLPSP